MTKNTIKSDNSNTQIAFNRKALHDYSIEKRFETGLVLQGWEVKSLRARQAQIAEGYVVIKKGEAWLLGAQITPLSTAAKHTLPDPLRTRKLLLQKKELMTLIGHIERKGYTLVPLSLYLKHGKFKLEIALAKGKKQHDKRIDAKERDWALEKQKYFKKSARSSSSL